MHDRYPCMHACIYRKPKRREKETTRKEASIKRLVGSIYMGVFGVHFTLAWLNVAWLCKNSLKAAPKCGGRGRRGGRSPSFVRRRRRLLVWIFLRVCAFIRSPYVGAGLSVLGRHATAFAILRLGHGKLQVVGHIGWGCASRASKRSQAEAAEREAVSCGAFPRYTKLILKLENMIP